MAGTMKVTGRNFLLKPNKEELTIFRPDAIFTGREESPPLREPVEEKNKTVKEGR